MKDAARPRRSAGADAGRPVNTRTRGATQRSGSSKRRRTREERAAALRWPRFWARQVDASICLAVMLVILSALGARLRTRGADLLLEFLYGPPLVGLLQLGYEALLVTALGTTIGKAIMGLRVETQYGRRIEFARACGRSASAWLRGSYACVMFPLLTALAWKAAARDLKARGTTSWDVAWETEVVGVRLARWHLALGAALAIGLASIAIALQMHAQGTRDTTAGFTERARRIIAPPTAISGVGVAAKAPAVRADAERAEPASFPVRTPPGRPDRNESAEALATWAEKSYGFFAKDGAARRAMFAWMVAGTRVGLPRNHALALGIDVVVSGLESGHGVCLPAATAPPDAGTGDMAKLVSNLRCER